MNITKKIIIPFLLGSFLTITAALADGPSFTSSLGQADLAVKRHDLQSALRIYDATRPLQSGNASNLCVLCHRYCDLGYLTDSTGVQKQLLDRALACAQQAVTDDPKNATAHASLAVCYAKNCRYVDIKTQLADSRTFKAEAEKAIALDPTQDVPYYLLGRWNYGIAGLGVLSRTYVKVVYGGLPHASYEDAILNFKKACMLSPNRILNHAGLAMAYEVAGAKTLELVELQKCCALKPLGPEDVEALKDARKKLAEMKG